MVQHTRAGSRRNQHLRSALVLVPQRNDQARVAVLRVRTPDWSWAAATRAMHSYIPPCARPSQITPRCFYNPTPLPYTPATVLVSTGMRVLSVYIQKRERKIGQTAMRKRKKEANKQTDRQSHKALTETESHKAHENHQRGTHSTSNTPKMCCWKNASVRVPLCERAHVPPALTLPLPLPVCECLCDSGCMK